MSAKLRAPRNRTLTLDDAEIATYRRRLLQLGEPASLSAVLNRTICQDALEVFALLPSRFVDLLVLDPPYNLTKRFNETQFSKLPQAE